MAGVTHEQGGESEHEDAAEYGAKARVGTVGRSMEGKAVNPLERTRLLELGRETRMVAERNGCTAHVQFNDGAP
jgi:hypothetical protein